MKHISLHLLGGFEACFANRSNVNFPTKKAKALLAYLALQPGQYHPRDKLAALLWGNASDNQARNNLRQTLALLRKAIAHSASPCVISDGDTLYLDPAKIEVDVINFEQLCDQADPAALERAAELYHGVLLEGFVLDEETFEEWMMSERQRLHERLMQALGKLLKHHLDTGEPEHGIQTAGRMLALDPLQENVHRALIRFYLQLGRRRSALQQYQICCEVLQKELGITPEAETEQLYQQMLSEPNNASAPAVNGKGQEPPSALSTPLKAEPAQVARAFSAYKRFLMISAVLLVLLAATTALRWPSKLGFTLELPDDPSIAVLPFANIGDDEQQAYFADGIAEDVITDLSKISGLLVIARHSSFTYQDRSMGALQAARELGVRYVLEGSVRRAGDQIRINVQLIDAEAGRYLWSERFDGILADIFGFQDRITRSIVNALAVQLSPMEEAQLNVGGTTNAAAYDTFLLGIRHLNAVDVWHSEENLAARRAFEKAIMLDPNYARAYAGLGYTHWFDFRNFNLNVRDATRAYQFAKQSLSLGDNSLARRLFANLYLIGLGSDEVSFRLPKQERLDLAVAEARKAVALEPNNADSLAELAMFLNYAGAAQEAVDLMIRARRLNPNFPDWYHIPAGVAYYLAGNYNKAVQELTIPLRNRHLPSKDIFGLLFWRAAAYAQAGDIAAAEKVLQTQAPEHSCKTLRCIRFASPFNLFKRPDDREHIIGGLRKAGLSEGAE